MIILKDFRFWLLAFIGSIYIYLIWAFRWVSSDGLSVVYQSYNVINGLGLVWNFGERTYVSTSPLFTIISIPLTYIFDIIFDALHFKQNKIVSIPILINLLLSTTSFIFLLRFIKSRITSFNRYQFAALAIILGLLLSSKFFIDFSTSGLENPLSYLTITVFAILCTNENTSKARFYIPIVAAFVFLTRYDFLLLLLPTLLYYLYKNKITKSVIIMTFVILSWFVFSFLYFGSIFPNSFYLKTNNSNIHQSFYYFKRNMFESKPMFLLIIIGLYCSFFTNKRIFAGIVSYLVYIFIVRDYMFGRLFTPLLPLCIISIIEFIYTKKIEEYKTNIIRGSSTCLVLFLVVFYFPPVVNLYVPLLMKGRFFIANERNHYTKVHDFLNTDFTYTKPNQNTTFVNNSLTMLHEPLLKKNRNSYFLDPVGLADPFITYYVKNFGNQGARPGHYVANIEKLKQEGLYETLINGKNKIKNKKIAELYNDVSSVSEDPIFDKERLKKIIKLHTHNYQK